MCHGSVGTEDHFSGSLPVFGTDTKPGTDTKYGRTSDSKEVTGGILSWSAINSGNKTWNNKVYWKFDASTYAKLTLSDGAFQVGDVLNVDIGNQNSSSKQIGFALKAKPDDGGNIKAETVAGNTATIMEYTLTADDIDADGSIKIYRAGSNASDARFYSFTVKRAVPIITTQPQSAAYATGDPIAALTVEATASAGDLSYQWYKNTTNEAVVDADHLISGAESASYTPTEAGFYYVVVTDGNGSVTSDVAEITVSAAEAPTINVTGAPADAVLVGTEVILTAEVTGTPTPTVTWYDNAQNAQLVGTGATFTVPTDNAGTYQYYAVASNGIGTDALSELQTIVVKEQVATPTITPNGAYFEESQDVTIECTTEDATVQYSIDNGATWIDMQSKKLTVTETTTIKAKAVKDGMIDSEIATATFNKVTLVEQTDVTGAATWDWSKFGKKEIKFTDTTTPKKNDFFVLQNVVSYGWCSSIDADFGDATQLNVSGEYAVRDSKYFQGGYVKFNTTVPGTLEITYSNTGSRTDEDQRRFVNVNGTNYGEGTMNATPVTTSDIPVAAGEVTIKGTLKGDGSDQYLRINKIVFTPLSDDNVDVVKVTDVNYATYVTTADIDFAKTDGVKAYKVTSVNPTIQYEEVTAAPAGTPLLIAAESASYILQAADPTSVPAEVTDNLLKAADNTVGDGQTIYVLGKKDDKAVWGLLTSGNTLSAGKAYLVIDGSNNAPFYSIEIGEGETTRINLNANDNLNFDQNAPRYNLSGQRVSDSYKGIVIVNGKKVVIK